MKISVVVLTKNEAKVLESCLSGLSWCDQILVIDDYSSDETLKIAKKYRAAVYQRRLGDDFAAQRNFALKKAKGQWVLFVDADEKVSPELKNEIIKKTKAGEDDGYYLKRIDHFGGRILRHGETANVKLLRLGKRDSGQWRRRVHEVWLIKGKVGEINAPLVHYPHHDLKEFLNKINRYSSLHARAILEEGQRPSLAKIIFFPILKFGQNYLLKSGFRDGLPGFVMAMMMSFHSFLAQSKLFIMVKNEDH